MKKIFFKFFLVTILGFGTLGIQAQEAVVAAGTTATGSGGTVSYSIGQVNYTTNTGTSGTVAQGVQQPFEISVVTGINRAKGIVLNCKVYPNPTTDFLYLKVDNYNFSKLSINVYDISGRLLRSRKIDSSITLLDLQNLEHSSYFVKVMKGNREVKTFHVVKN